MKLLIASITRICIFLLIPTLAWSQTKDEFSNKTLANVEVQAFEKKRNPLRSPDAIVLLDSSKLLVGNALSFLPALNSQAGIRMEERSPGSYRLAIRGSSLRAPFGVRNVKIYWNQMSFTDAGNNSYFSLLDPEQFQQVVVSKGPSGGLYGAGTGGVLLLSSQAYRAPSVQHQEIVHSLGGYKQSWDIRLGKPTSSHRFYTSFWQQKGYRDQSAMKKQWFSYEWNKSFGTTGAINLIAYYGDLAYQTPGGLTLKQYQENPTQARPAAGINKGAVEQMATFKLKSYFVGAHVSNAWNSNWAWDAIHAVQVNSIENPTIRNYEFREEPNLNNRGVIHYKQAAGKGQFTWDLGYEFQVGQFDSRTYGNRKGVKDSLQFEQNTRVQQGGIFTQLEYDGIKNWAFTLAGSYNKLWTEFQSSEGIFSPRLAIVRKLGANQHIVAKVAHGFSPPSIAEIRPSTNVINRSLRAEKGWNYELSYRGWIPSSNLTWDLSLYQFNLDETIVLRRAADGADFYDNVGKTTQQGMELSLQWTASSYLQVLSATTWQNFRFTDYSSAGKSFNGNFLTGTSPFQQSLLFVWKLLPGLSWNQQLLMTDYVYLNDANTDVLPSSRVWNSKISYRKNRTKYTWELWLAADNIGDEKYSAGPDLNAIGARYYNASPRRNFSGGLTLNFF
ncbi:TonB-dependent receptor [Aquirufa beregesia]